MINKKETMKNIFQILSIICLVAFFIHCSALSQTMDSIYIEVDKKPDFSYKEYGSLHEKINGYFKENSGIKILKVGEQTGAYTAIIVVKFVVEKDGTITNIEFMTIGLEKEKSELKSLLMKSGTWRPGLIKGEAVRTALIFPIHVILE